jgi:uncharacterized RmlC-like cupin family protein
MTRAPDRICSVVRPSESEVAATGLEYFVGISNETAGATSICLQRVTIPPATRAKAHLHERHESAAYVLSGEVVMWFGDRLERHLIVRPGEFAFIPAGVPHLPANYDETEAAEAILARSDPYTQESVLPLPELDGLPHLERPPGR